MHVGLFPLRSDVTPALSAVRDADKRNTAFARISTELGLEAHVPVAITPIFQHVMGWLRRACRAVSGAIGTVWRAHDIRAIARSPLFGFGSFVKSEFSRGGKGFSAGLLTARMMVAVGFMCSVGARSFAAVLFDPRNLKFHDHHAVRQVIKSSDRSGYRAWLQSRAAERDLARCGYIFWDTSTLLSIISFLNIQSRVIPRASIHQPFGLVKPQTDSLLLWFPSHKPRSDVALRRCNLTFISFHIFSPISARFALLQVELFIRDNVAPVYILTHLTYLFPCGKIDRAEALGEPTRAIPLNSELDLLSLTTSGFKTTDTSHPFNYSLLLQGKSIRANQVQFHVRYRDAIARRLTLGQVGYPSNASLDSRLAFRTRCQCARRPPTCISLDLSRLDLNPDVFRWQVGGGGIGEGLPDTTVTQSRRGRRAQRGCWTGGLLVVHTGWDCGSPRARPVRDPARHSEAQRARRAPTSVGVEVAQAARTAPGSASSSRDAGDCTALCRTAACEGIRGLFSAGEHGGALAEGHRVRHADGSTGDEVSAWRTTTAGRTRIGGVQAVYGGVRATGRGHAARLAVDWLGGATATKGRVCDGRQRWADHSSSVRRARRSCQEAGKESVPESVDDAHASALRRSSDEWDDRCRQRRRKLGCEKVSATVAWMGLTVVRITGDPDLKLQRLRGTKPAHRPTCQGQGVGRLSESVGGDTCLRWDRSEEGDQRVKGTRSERRIGPRGIGRVVQMWMNNFPRGRQNRTWECRVLIILLDLAVFLYQVEDSFDEVLVVLGP
ncbi:hypothetical protein DFH06DRAFT_1299037 [Mycena polygramma]|nr:hypothetical protein DFH06DRAFT_1299037 [Mycena polygramma]